MEPIGLTFKTNGELMVVHLCLNCAKISCNRIAGDDNAHTIICLLEETHKLNNLGIKLLTEKDKPEVLSILYGNI